MRYTLLELVQTVLSSMDSEEVNSINDTVESEQVVQIIKTVYNDLISRSDITKHKILFNLTSSSDVTKPILMTKPTNILNIDWLQYNKILSTGTDPDMSDIQFLPVDDFIRMMNGFRPSESNVDTMSYSSEGFTITFNYRNDVGPCYYTSFDDNTIIFDAYDSAVDTILQSSKTLGYGSKELTFVESNVFVPDLQPQQFALLLNEAKSLAWTELKQTPHEKAERTAKRNWVHVAKTRQNIPSGKFGSGANAFDKLPNFGRK